SRYLRAGPQQGKGVAIMKVFMKRAALLCLLSAAAVWIWCNVDEAPGGKGKQPAPTPRPIYKTPSVNPGVTPVVPHKPIVPKPNPRTDFHLPDNFQRPTVLPKTTGPIVTLPPVKEKHVGPPSGHLPGGATVGLPRDTGHAFYRPKLPAGTKHIDPKEF